MYTPLVEPGLLLLGAFVTIIFKVLSMAVEHSFWTFNICFSFVYELLKVISQ